MEEDDSGGLNHHTIRVASSDVAMENNEISEPNPSPSLKQQAAEMITASLETYRSKPFSFWLLLFLSSGAMLTAFPASSLLSRLYYTDGGKSKWILSWAAVAGWPLPALLLLPLYLLGKATPTPLSLSLCLWYALLGFLSAADNLMFAWAYAYLPASTASLVAASSLAFSAIFGRAIAKNTLTLSSINAVAVITAGVVVVALDSGSDRPPGVTAGQYALGFALDVLGSALHGLIFALSELVFARALGRRSFHVVLEQQAAVSLCAFAFTSAGLAIAEGFPAMRREAARFAHGGGAYANVMVWTAVTFQVGVLGGTGVLFLASTVLAGVLNAVRVPLTSVAAVIWFHDPMSGFKILALLITVWGFASYMVGHSTVKKTSTS
ncbi:unnamed protein product [Urochloa humidicola]